MLSYRVGVATANGVVYDRPLSPESALLVAQTMAQLAGGLRPVWGGVYLEPITAKTWKRVGRKATSPPPEYVGRDVADALRAPNVELYASRAALGLDLYTGAPLDNEALCD